MGVHRASHHLVRRPLQRVPLWGRLLTCGGLAIRLPPLDAPLRPSENRSALFAACRYVGQFVKLRATWRIPRQAALRAGYQPVRPKRVSLPHSTWFTLPWRPWHSCGVPPSASSAPPRCACAPPRSGRACHRLASASRTRPKEWLCLSAWPESPGSFLRSALSQLDSPPRPFLEC